MTPLSLSVAVRTLNIVPGARVTHDKETYTITHIGDLNSVVARCESSGIPRVLKLRDLLPVDDAGSPTQIELGLITDKRWRNAQRRWEIIRPLIEGGDTSRNAIDIQVKETGASRASIWRWLRRYREGGGMIALLDPEFHGTKGRSLLRPEVEAIVRECIATAYLSPRQLTVQATFERRAAQMSQREAPGARIRHD